MDWDISPMVGSGAGDRHFDGGFQQADAERVRKQSVGPRTKTGARKGCTSSAEEFQNLYRADAPIATKP